MKKFSLILIGFFCWSSSFSQGIRFRKDASWQSVLAAAAQSNKVIFVDAYTDWCGPCKRMDKQVFSLKKVGKVFNSHFINFKLNAEKGSGQLIAKRYNVISYPTYLFIKGDGTLIYKARGFMAADQLLEQVKNALQEAKEPVTIVQLEKRYPTHRTDKHFMYIYVKRRTALNLKNFYLLDEYFNLLTPKEQAELKNLQLVVDNGSFLSKNIKIGIAFYALLRNRNKFHLLKTDKYNHTLDIIIDVAKERTLSIAIKEKNDSLFNEVLRFNRSKDVFEGDNTIKLRYFWKTGQFEKYFTIAKQYVDNQLMTLSQEALDSMDKKAYNEIIPGIDSSFAKEPRLTSEEKKKISYTYKRTQTIQLTNLLNRICRNVSIATTSVDTLGIGLAWIKRCIGLAGRDTGYFHYVYPVYLDTYAVYLYKLNKKKKAILYEKRAIEFLKAYSGGGLLKEYADRLSKMEKGEALSGI